MSLPVDVPTLIDAAGDSLLATTAFVTTLGYAAGDLYYPEFDERTADVARACVLVYGGTQYRRGAPGESRGDSGAIWAVLFVDEDTLTEAAFLAGCDALARELCEHTGEALFVTAARFENVSEPTRAERAAAADDAAHRVYRTCRLVMEWAG